MHIRLKRPAILAAVSAALLCGFAASAPAGPYDQYIWETSNVTNISPDADDLIQELQYWVQETLDAGHLASLRIHYGDVVGEGYFMYNEPGRIIGTLAYAYPHLTAAQKQQVVTYVNDEVANGFGPWGRWGKETEDPNLGARRERHTSERIYGWDRWWGLDGQHRPRTFTLYGLWLYAYRTGDWGPIENNWSKIKDQYARHGDDGNLYGTMCVHIAMARMAEHQNDSTMLATAISNAETQLAAGEDFSTIDTNQQTPYQKFFDSRLVDLLHHGWLFMNTSPEMGRFMNDHVRSEVIARDAEAPQRWLHWNIRQAYYVGGRWTGDEQVGLTMEIYAMRFPVARWVAQTDPQVMEDWLDSPVGRGDCYYIESLVQTIEQYGTTGWVDVRTGTIDDTAPDAVTDLAVDATTSSSASLSWTAPGDDGAVGSATSYDIRYSTAGAITESNWASATQATGEPAPQIGGSAESFVVTGLNADTTYYFAIKASDESGNTAGVSNSPSGTTDVASAVDLAINFQLSSSSTPNGYIADDGSSYGARNGQEYGWSSGNTSGARERDDHADQRYDTLVHFNGYTWELAVPNGDYTILLVCGDPSYADQVNTLDVEGTILTDPDGQDNFDEYSFSVTVSDGRLTVAPAAGASNPKICFIDISGGGSDPGDTTAPEAVTDLAAMNPSESSIDLTWTAPGDDGATGTAASYDVRYSTAAIDETNWSSATQATGEPAPSTAGTGESMTVTGLSAETTYYFAIKAADEAGNVAGVSNSPSETTLISQDVTAPADVTDLAAQNPTAGSVELVWTAVGDDGTTGSASSYDIRYSTAAIDAGNFASANQVSGEPTPQSAGSAESFTVTGLSAETTYYFAIQVADEAGNVSGVSNSPSETTLAAPTNLTITNLSGSSGLTYTVQYDALDANNLNVYTDRTYKFGSVPASLVGATYIQTPNNDKADTGLSVSFDINQECTVYVAHDDRVAVDPTWLGGWSDTGDDLFVADDFSNPMSLLSKVFSAGTVTLSQNTDDGSASQISMYNIVVVPTGGGTPSDTIAPEAVTDLLTGTAASSSIPLSWTAPGDDGATGTAASYDVRYSTAAIDEANWASATQATGEPAPSTAGTVESFTVTGLSADTTYYFAVKAVDEAGNIAGVSNSPSATTDTAPTQLSITNVSSSSGATYTVQYDALDVNSLDVFTDRSYVFSSVPTWLVGATYIQTANDDKSVTGLTVSFDINQQCTVYVAHDDRFSSTPSWMSDWTNEADSLLVSDGDSTGATLYSKVFSSGTVTLYENTVGGEGNNMYSIVVVPYAGGY